MDAPTINYNRATRQVWLDPADGRRLWTATAARGERMIDAAARLVAEHGYTRVGDYCLITAGAPLRQAPLRTA